VEVMVTGLSAPILGYPVRPLRASHLFLAQMQTKHTTAADAAHSVSSAADLQVSRIVALPSSAVAPLTTAIYQRRRIDVARERKK